MYKIICFFILLPVAAFSSSENFFEVGAGYMYQKDNLAVDSENELIDDYSKSKDGFSEIIPIIRFNYTKGEADKKYYIGSSAIGSSGGGLSAGIKLPGVLDSRLNLYLKYKLPSDVWKNPYMLNEKRSSTYKDSYGIGAEFSDIAASGYSYKLELNFQNVRDDEAADIYDNMGRDGYTLSQQFLKKVKLSSSIILDLGVTYDKCKLDGNVNSYETVGIKANLTYFNRKGYSARFMYSAGYSKFRAKHPVFGKTREDISENFFMILRKNNIFGYKDVFVNLYGGIGGSFSNIDFYESRFNIAGLSMGYSF